MLGGPPRIHGRRGPRHPRRRRPARRDRARPRARVGHARRRRDRTSSELGRAAGRAGSRSRPTTSRTRWPAPPASTSRGPSTRRAGVRPNVALLWLADPSKADVTLTQARAVTFGLGKLQFITRTGVEILLSQAAGIVISLLVAFSLVALLAAGTMLAAGAHAEVQRRLTGFGVQRALGFGPGRIAAQQAVESALVAVPAAVAGIALGALLVARPAAELLAALNELGPGLRAAPPARRCPLPPWSRWSSPPPPGRPGAPRAARRWRSCAAATCRATAKPRHPRRRAVRARRAVRHRRARALDRGRRDDRRVRGRGDADARARVAARAAARGPRDGRQALPARGAARPDPDPRGARRCRACTPSGERYSIDAADSFRLGEPIRLVAYPGDHTRFEDPPLAEGRRIRGPNEVEVGVGDGGRARAAARAACSPRRSPTAARCASASPGSCARSRTTAGSRGCEPDKLLALRPDLSPQVVVRLKPGADPATVTRGLVDLGARLQPVGAAQTDNAAFLAVLAAVLRGVGPGRRPRLPVRARPGADRHRPRAPRRRRAAARVRRRRARRSASCSPARRSRSRSRPPSRRGPRARRSSARSSPASPRASPRSRSAPTLGQIALVAGGLLALAVIATALVARRVLREPVIAGLREE